VHVLGIGPVTIGFGARLTTWQVSLHQKSTKSLTQVAFELTHDEGCDSIESPVTPLPA
jgi:hypothetical protein